jgi:hypothetical protein
MGEIDKHWHAYFGYKSDNDQILMDNQFFGRAA